ncbi:MAG: GYD domain-containing protein, partial [Desulfobacteraceae bacterium]
GKLTNESIQGLVSNPQNRAEAVAKLVDAYGGEMVSYHMLLNGDIDFIIFSEIPQDKSKDLALVNALIVRGAGGVESITTVPAMKAEDAVLQMQKAQNLTSAMTYRTPTEP